MQAELVSSNGISGPEDQLHRQDVYPKGFALIFDREGWDREYILSLVLFGCSINWFGKSVIINPQ